MSIRARPSELWNRVRRLGEVLSIRARLSEFKRARKMGAYLSIRTRLALWYGGILALLLLLFGGAVYGLLQGSLLAGVDRSLADIAAQIQSGARRNIAITPFDWREVVTLPPLDVFAQPDIFVQVRYPDGQVAATSANLRDQVLPALPAAAWENVLDGQVDLRTERAGAVRLRLRSEAIFSQGRPVGVLQVAASLRSMDEALQGLLLFLLVGGGLGLLLAVLGGAFLARQALSPIEASGHHDTPARRGRATGRR